VRIRLTPTTIYFDYGGTGTTPVWVNNLTKSRPTSLSGSPSKIILGKGVEQVSYTNADLDNNYTTPGNLGIQFIDDLITRKYPANPPEPSLEMEETQELGGGEIHYTFTYDDYGNCITKSDGINTWEYAYDCENRLLSIAENGQITEEYIYNGDGQRIKKIDSDSTRIYIYSGINILYEINMTTQMDAIYIYGPTGRIAKKVNDITEFYHTDHLGSTRLTTSETGSKVTEVQYKPFGEQINTTDERYTFNRKELDSTGLYYYGARYYDPDTGRFLTRDPLQGDRVTPQTLNRYAYCLNNPLKYIDPIGTEGTVLWGSIQGCMEVKTPEKTYHCMHLSTFCGL
jgi:RHS repeat-associated protein